jgi:putative N6-adenine-specific DNA methylase
MEVRVAHRGGARREPGPWNARIEIAPGLEEALMAELVELGLTGQPDTGGVELTVDAPALLRLQRCSRLASRVTVRLGTVGAESLEMLADRARKQPWAQYVHPRQPVEVRATVTRSRVRYRERVEAKVEHAIADALRGPRLPGGRPPREPARIGVRVEDDKATFRVDASGELLHKRGWRQDPGKAPLRENLAAAVLRLAGWRPGVPLLDPMSGSGTFAIEAALWTRGAQPGARRGFACQVWPCWPSPPEPSAPATRDPGAPIIASDRDPRATEAARANARRAGVLDRIAWLTDPIESIDVAFTRGIVVLNPPWGERLGDVGTVARLHARWAVLARERWPAATIATVVPDVGWARRSWGEGARAAARFASGGTRLTLWVRSDARGGSAEA